MMRNCSSQIVRGDELLRADLSRLVGVNKVGDVAQDERFTDIKSVKYCRVDTGINARDDQHLRRPQGINSRKITICFKQMFWKI